MDGDAGPPLGRAASLDSAVCWYTAGLASPLVAALDTPGMMRRREFSWVPVVWLLRCLFVCLAERVDGRLR